MSGLALSVVVSSGLQAYSPLHCQRMTPNQRRVAANWLPVHAALVGSLVVSSLLLEVTEATGGLRWAIILLPLAAVITAGVYVFFRE